jgi:hypothetical protein
MPTLKKLNKNLKILYPNIQVAKGEGYFFIYSDDKYMGEFLSSKYTTSIHVNKVNDLTLNQWIEEIKLLINQKD